MSAFFLDKNSKIIYSEIYQKVWLSTYFLKKSIKKGWFFMEKTFDKKKALFYVLLPFLMGLMIRTMILSTEEHKIVLYRTFEPTYTIEIAQK